MSLLRKVMDFTRFQKKSRKFGVEVLVARIFVTKAPIHRNSGTGDPGNGAKAPDLLKSHDFFSSQPDYELDESNTTSMLLP